MPVTGVILETHRHDGMEGPGPMNGVDCSAGGTGVGAGMSDFM